MRIILAAVGRLKAGAERELCERYVARAAALGRGLGLSPLITRECPESRAGRAPQRMEEEAEAIRAMLSAGTRLVACDGRGAALSSRAFAEDIRRARDSAVPNYVLAIGGADGLAPSFRESAALVLSFGEMTWPHQLARILAAEQIYRATTILAGHPYHRE